MAPPPTFDRVFVRQAIERLGVMPRRGLGQHFLADPALLSRMADQAELTPLESAVEVGAGLGQWTAELARRARQVWAFEIDPALVEEATRNLAHAGNVTVIRRDGAEFAQALAPCPGPVVFFSNLPYAAYREILLAALTTPLAVRAFFFTIQEEVFDKLAAGPGNALYNGLGAVLSSYCTFTRLAAVPCSAFVPEPHIRSIYFRAVRHGPVPDDAAALFEHAEHLFCWKRKHARKAVEFHAGPARLADAEAKFGARLDDRLRNWAPAEVVDLARWAATSAP